MPLLITHRRTDLWGPDGERSLDDIILRLLPSQYWRFLTSPQSSFWRFITVFSVFFQILTVPFRSGEVRPRSVPRRTAEQVLDTEPDDILAVQYGAEDMPRSTGTSHYHHHLLLLPLSNSP